MEPIEASLFRENVDRSDFWIDNFNLVIRLSKVQQLAFRYSAFYATSCWLCPWKFHFYLITAVQTARNLLPFLSAAQAFEATHDHDRCCRQVLAFQVWPFLLLMVFWWSWTYRASNSLELEKPFMPMWLDLTSVPFGNNARLSRVELSPCSVFFSFFDSQFHAFLFPPR